MDLRALAKLYELDGPELHDLGVDKPTKALLDEALARAALGTEATVRFVGGGMEQSPSEGIGAILRYAV